MNSQQERNLSRDTKTLLMQWINLKLYFLHYCISNLKLYKRKQISKMKQNKTKVNFLVSKLSKEHFEKRKQEQLT